MSRDNVGEVMHNGCRIEIWQDADICADSDYWWPDYAKLISFHRGYGSMGVKNETWDDPNECWKHYKDTGHAMFVVYAYDHSGICFSLSNDKYPFNDRWDSGVFGFLAIDRKALGVKKVSRNHAYNVIETLNNVESGQVYGFTAYAGDKEIDSCGGFIGDWRETILPEARESIDNYVKCRKKEHARYLKNCIKRGVPVIYRHGFAL